ncbi:MAG: alanine racemase [Polyangiales bacterium]
MTSIRPTRAEISRAALRENVAVLRRAAPGAALWPMVKANAYGHGMVPVAVELASAGVDGLGVATVEEGLALREEAALHATPIVVFGADYGSAHAAVLGARLVPVVHRAADVAAFARAGADMGTTAPVSVEAEIDTGMARLGFRHDRAAELLDALRAAPNVRLAGLFTHFAASEDPKEDAFTKLQLERFEAVVAAARAAGHAPRIHAANSGGIFRHAAAHYDAVRPGIATYGVAPSDSVRAPLVPALRLVSAVSTVRDLAADDSVGYDRTFVASAPMRVASVPIGYGDGLHRTLSNRGAVLVAAWRCPVVGRVSMDSIVVDVTGAGDVGPGAEAVLIGAQGDAAIRAEDVAAWSGTNTYEVFTSLSARVSRVMVEAHAGYRSPAKSR